MMCKSQEVRHGLKQQSAKQRPALTEQAKHASVQKQPAKADNPADLLGRVIEGRIQAGTEELSGMKDVEQRFLLLFNQGFDRVVKELAHEPPYLLWFGECDYAFLS